MCSISGFTWEDKTLIRKMNDILSYRGPDDTGIYIDERISLGHNRLSIIDLSHAGHQPMSNRDGTLWIIFNGEVYNYKKIRQELEKLGYTFLSNTDTEVVVNSYEQFGPECVKIFNGMFAFAIWDTKKKELFLARDRIGIKPLYYYYDGLKLIFSSEIKAILCHDINKQIDFDAFNSFFKYRFIPSDKTILKGIRKLMPGYYMYYKNGKITLRKYWKLNWKIENKSESYYLKKLNKLLKSSVELRLQSDVPLGAFLSGGVDSSLIVAINYKLRKDPIKTFTIGYGYDTDEFKYARIVSNYLDTDHHEIILDFDLMTRKLPLIIWHMDEPHSEITMIPLYFLSKFSKKEVTVVNTGEGADEIFSGYNDYYLGSKMFQFIPNILKTRLYLWYYPRFNKSLRNKLFSFSFTEDNTLQTYLTLKNKNSFPNDFLNRILYFDLKHELTNWELNRTDKMTMAFSMEARVPMLDFRIVELSSRLPIKYKQPNLIGKYILKKLALSYLPREIVLRKKQGFTTPEQAWIKNRLKDSIETLLFFNKKPFYDYYYIKKLIQKQSSFNKKNPFQRYSFQLLNLLFFDIWYEIYMNNTKIEKIEALLS